MTALADDRGFPEERWKFKTFTLKSGTKAYLGGSACMDLATAKVVPAVAGAGLVHIGFFAEQIDATSTDKEVNVDLVEEIAIMWLANAGASSVAATDLLKECFFADDQTVSMSPAGTLAGRVWAVDATKGVAVQKMTSRRTVAPAPIALPAFAANDSAPADIVSGATYTVPATAGVSTVTLPTAAADGTTATFIADGALNGHTVQYRDGNGNVNLTSALTASKRHMVLATKIGGKWVANAYAAP